MFKFIPIEGLEAEFINPERSTKSSAGFDLFVPGEDAFVLQSKRSITIDFAMTIETSAPIVVEVSARSSLYKKKGLVLGKSVYRFYPGESIVIEFCNLTNEDVTIHPKDVLCQAVVVDSAVEEGILQDPDYFMSMEFVDDLHKVYDNPSCNLGSTSVFYFQCPQDMEVPAFSNKLIFSDIKASFQDDKYLCLKLIDAISEKRLFLANGIGIVDADYYSNSSNDGNIGFNVYNCNYLPVKINKGDIIGIGYLRRYYTTGEVVETIRGGGFGSTNN